MLLNQLNLNETSTCKVSFQANLTRYHATESWHKLWNKMIKNKNIIPDVPRGDTAATFQLITNDDCLVPHLYKLFIYHALCRSCTRKVTLL
jgi:hypothetical protein